MPTTPRPSPLAVAAAFAAIYLFWGSNFLAIRVAVETIPPFLLMGARALVAGISLFGWALVRREGRLRRRHWYGAAVVGTLLFLVGHGGLAWAQQHVPSGIAALLMATIPIWMVLLEWRLLQAPRPGAATWTGLALGLMGIALLVGSGRGGAAATPPGPALVLMASAFGWAAGSVGSRLVPTPASVAAATGQQLIAGGILLLAVAAASGELSPPPVASIRSLLAMAYMVVAASLVSFTAYVWLLRVSTPGRVSSYAFVNPVVAVFVGWAFGGEALTARTIVAAAVIVVGVVLIVTSRARARRV